LQKSYDELELRVEERTAELKENQARLEQAEERSRLLLESAQEGIFGVGEDGLLNFINPAGLAMLGFKADELIGQKIHQLIHHTRPDGALYPIEECPMHHSLTQGVIGSRDDEVLWRKDGTSFPAEYTSVPIRKNDLIAGTVVVFRDITERGQMEDEMKRNVEELEQFSKLAIGREIKMIQLKEEINELRGQLGQGEKYEIVK
jgi:two-component system sensor histidine kinase/response regulator